MIAPKRGRARARQGARPAVAGRLLLLGCLITLVLYVAYHPALARDLLVSALDLLIAAQPRGWLD